MTSGMFSNLSNMPYAAVEMMATFVVGSGGM